jgi:hypothetical protein
MTAHGVRPYWILDYANPCYPGTVWPSCDTPACIAGYGRFAAAAAEHFKGRDIIFESVNEPNGMGMDNATDIVALCRAAYPGFVAAGGLFVGPALSTFDPPYMVAAVEAGLLNYVMAVTVHPYPATAPETTLGDFQNLFALVKQFSPKNKTLEIYDGEWGYTSASPPCFYGNRVDPVTQGKYLARMWLVTTLAGTKISIAYDWHDDGSDITNCEDNFGSVNFAATGNRSEPFLPKPSYHAALTLQNGLGNTDEFVGRIAPAYVPPTFPAHDVFVLEFSGGLSSGPAFAAWHNSSRVNSTVSISFAPQSSMSASTLACWTVVGTFGDVLEQKLCAVKGLIVLNVTDGPAYLLPLGI